MELEQKVKLLYLLHKSNEENYYYGGFYENK